MGNQLKDITTGHYNELLNREEILSEKRMHICRKCPLILDPMFGPMCNSKKYLNVDTGKTSYIPQEGFKKGCGCRLSAKTRVKDSKCPLGKW